MKKIFLFLPALLLVLSSCKKPDDPAPDPNQQEIDELTQAYGEEGFNFLGRLYTYQTSTIGGFFIYLKDLRFASGKLTAAWQIEDYLNMSGIPTISTYWGTFENQRFKKNDYLPCGTPLWESGVTKYLTYTIDGQGGLFTSYRYRQDASISTTWYQQFCHTSGTVLSPEWFYYTVLWKVNNGLITGVGADNIYSGYSYNSLLYYNYNGTTPQGTAIPNLQPSIQNYDYTVSENGNGYGAYTSFDAGGAELDGKLNLIGFDGVSWVNLGSVAVSGIRKIAGFQGAAYYEPFRVKLVRNGDNPYVVIFRDNNTIGVYKFDGLSLTTVAESVPYSFDIYSIYTETVNGKFCVYNNKLTCTGSTLGGEYDGKTIFQLNGSQFTELKTIGYSNTYVRGVYSDNTTLWAAVEVWTAVDGVFLSPVDILELQ